MNDYSLGTKWLLRVTMSADCGRDCIVDTACRRLTVLKSDLIPLPTADVRKLAEEVKELIESLGLDHIECFYRKPRRQNCACQGCTRLRLQQEIVRRANAILAMPEGK